MLDPRSIFLPSCVSSVLVRMILNSREEPGSLSDCWGRSFVVTVVYHPYRPSSSPLYSKPCTARVLFQQVRLSLSWFYMYDVAFVKSFPKRSAVLSKLRVWLATVPRGTRSIANASCRHRLWYIQHEKQAEDDVQMELSEDGILSVVSGDKKLWSSSLTPLGKRLPPFR